MVAKKNSLLDLLQRSKNKAKDFISRARDWFHKKVTKTKTTPIQQPEKIKEPEIEKSSKEQEKDLRQEIEKAKRTRTNDLISPGKMYNFWYDPKWKKILPYYDRFPLIFPIEFYDDGFLGINFHYLYPKDRAILLDALLENITNKRYDETTIMKINYGLLKSASKYNSFKPCIKRYLTVHLRSKFIEIYPDEWEVAMFLDTAKFVKHPKEYVWSESRKKY